jgi:hypothetical protein
MKLQNLLVEHKIACSFSEARRLVACHQVKQGSHVFRTADENVDITKDDVRVGKHQVIKKLKS